MTSRSLPAAIARRIRRIATVAALAGTTSCGDAPSGPATTTPRPLFVDRTAGSGVDFLHDPCKTGKKLLVEINSGGVSLLDYDSDGDLDLFFAQGGPIPGFDGADRDLRDRLYRNDGAFRFTDVTTATGATDPALTYAAACPDIDGDGDPDLYLANAGRNTWLRNDVAESGRFVDVTAEWGADDPGWSTAAAFADFDADGDLDLYVVDYVELAFDHPGCGNKELGPAGRTYCHPDEFAPTDDRLYRNDDGRFVDITAQTPVAGTGGAGLGAVLSDFDGDGDVDLFVANDSTPNFLWRNEGGMRFTEAAADAWVAVDGTGVSTAAMGCDFGDVDGDLDFDLVVANLAMEVNNLYVNDGQGRFDDRSAASGFGPPSLLDVGFGCDLFDADLDGDLDALVVNGHVIDNVELYEPAQSFRQRPLYLENDGRGRFRSLGSAAGPWFGQRHVARGLAVCDLDGDGDEDAVVAHWEGAPTLLENTTDGRAPWVGIKLRGVGKNRDALGAKVTVETPLGRRCEEVRGTRSYLAYGDVRLRFALGGTPAPVRASVRWPSGRQTDHGPLEPGRVHQLEESAR